MAAAGVKAEVLEVQCNSNNILEYLTTWSSFKDEPTNKIKRYYASGLIFNRFSDQLKFAFL